MILADKRKGELELSYNKMEIEEVYQNLLHCNVVPALIDYI